MVVVSHGEVIAALVGALHGRPVAEWEALSLKNALGDRGRGLGRASHPELVLVNVVPDEPKP